MPGIMPIAILKAWGDQPTRLEPIVQPDLVKHLQRRGMVATGSRHLIEKVFVGQARRGIYVSDGTLNIALLKQEHADEALGVAHFGIWVDDLDAAEQRITAAGGSYVTGRPSSPNSFYEAKFKTPTGQVFDVTHTGWAGAVRDVTPVIE